MLKGIHQTGMKGQTLVSNSGHMSTGRGNQRQTEVSSIKIFCLQLFFPYDFKDKCIKQLSQIYISGHTMYKGYKGVICNSNNIRGTATTKRHWKKQTLKKAVMEELRNKKI